MTGPLPRYEATRRREFLRRTAVLGTLGLVPTLVACGDDDAELRATDDPTTSTAPSSAGGSAPAGSDPTTTTEGAVDETTTSSADAGETLPNGARVQVSFTYAASGDGFGPVRNPFVVAWVEDGTGALVRNLSLWYNPPKGNRWVNQLSSWYAADEAYYAANGSDDIEAVTGASRPAGAYTVEWDATTEDGGRALAGTYRILVESAREHGPHSLISAEVELGSQAVTAQLSSDGELTGGAVAYSV